MTEVGKFYRVPCLLVEGGFDGLDWVPVIGPKHADAELGVDFEHFHIDWRFVPERFFFHSNHVRGTPHGRIISTDLPWSSFRQGIFGSLVLKQMKCKRLMPVFPKAPAERLWSAMEISQQARCNKLKDGHTCPHRNIDLRPFEKADGTAICPGHGLRWNMRTGEMILRHSLGGQAAS